MGKVLIEEDTLTGLGNAIRSKTEKTDLLTPHQMIDEINALETGGEGADINEYFETKYSSGNIQKYIKKIPELDTSNVTNFASLFNTCERLVEIPEFDMSEATNITGMFQNCKSLTKLPPLNVSKANSLSSVFASCENLLEIPELDTSNVTSIHQAFSRCYKIKAIPQLDTSKVTSMYGAFDNCESLEIIPKLDASKVTSISSIVNNCKSLITFGGLEGLGEAYDTSKATNYSSYALDISKSVNLTYESLRNLISGLCDIATRGCNPQQFRCGSTLMALLTEDDLLELSSKGWNAV